MLFFHKILEMPIGFTSRSQILRITRRPAQSPNQELFFFCYRLAVTRALPGKYLWPSCQSVNTAEAVSRRLTQDSEVDDDTLYASRRVPVDRSMVQCALARVMLVLGEGMWPDLHLYFGNLKEAEGYIAAKLGKCHPLSVSHFLTKGIFRGPNTSAVNESVRVMFWRIWL